MNNKRFQLLLSICFLLGITSVLSAQVTIGTDGAPVPGALLELKNVKNVMVGSANATKGLGLPRVNLSSSSRLILGDHELDVSEYEKHAGLLVYNVASFCNDAGSIFYPGLYVWDGEEWNNLGENTGNLGYANPDKVWALKDQDGNDIRAARFGNQVWMIDNIAVKSFDTESEAYGNVVFPTSPKIQNPNTDEASKELNWCYPGSAVAIPSINYKPTGLNPYFYENYKSYGLFYSWLLATGNSSPAYHLDADGTTIVFAGDGFSQRMTAATTAPGGDEVEIYQQAHSGKPYIQGICPNGWHLPSDRDWNILEKELFTNPEKYSYITQVEQQAWQPNAWDTDWENVHRIIPNNRFQSFRAGNANSHTSCLAQVFKTSCFSPFQTINSKYYQGTSFIAADGGFNITPVGGISPLGLRAYGEEANMLSSSFTSVFYDQEYTNCYVGRRFIFVEYDPTNPYHKTDGMVGNGNPHIANFNTVRCIYHGDGTMKPGVPTSWSDLPQFK